MSPRRLPAKSPTRRADQTWAPTGTTISDRAPSDDPMRVPLFFEPIKSAVAGSGVDVDRTGGRDGIGRSSNQGPGGSGTQGRTGLQDISQRRSGPGNGERVGRDGGVCSETGRGDRGALGDPDVIERDDFVP